MVLDNKVSNYNLPDSFSLQEIEITDNIKIILENRYLLKDEDGVVIETPDEMFRRIAKHIASIEEDKEEWEEIFYSLMKHKLFLPNSPTLMNAGTEAGTLSACFVLPIEDTMQGILQAGEDQGMTLKYGGGTGFSLADIRPKGAPIKTTHGAACGPVQVLRHLDSVSQLVTQGGKRDGANMAILPINHPDIREFIHCKDKNIGVAFENQVLKEFNISIAITDDFMNAVSSRRTISLIDPNTEEITEEIDAIVLWDEICQSAWETGDPGLFFIDTVNEFNQTPQLGRLEGTNPCGEVPLYPYESCNLGSINLAAFINSDYDAEDEFASLTERFDVEALAAVSRIAIRFLDNVVTLNEYPLKQMRPIIEKTRKIGLGVMGWADALVLLDIAYDSDAGVELAEEVMEIIDNSAAIESQNLSDIRGKYLAATEDDLIRNSTRTCIAPTGTISRIANVSSGIEPYFALATKSNVMNGEVLIDINPYFEKIARREGFYSKELIEHVLETGTITGRTDVPEKWQKIFKTTNEISIDSHIEHQTAFQKHTDLAVSKTINLPNSATITEIAYAYTQAWVNKCKGVTVYRDGCRSFQVLNAGVKDNSTTESMLDQLTQSVVTDRLAGLDKLPFDAKPAVRYKITLPNGINAYIGVTEDKNGNPTELFINVGKSGTDMQADAQAIARSCSAWFQEGLPIEKLYKQYIGIHSGNVMFDSGEKILSLPDAVAHILGLYIDDEEYKTEITSKLNGLHIPCPDCQNELAVQEGCMTCTNPRCGYAAC